LHGELHAQVLGGAALNQSVQNRILKRLPPPASSAAECAASVEDVLLAPIQASGVRARAA
jgi:hypothetical protein